MATFAIGDVQGCFDELQTLLQTIHFNADRDRLWFCGDVVNRGPSSLDTLRYIHSLRDNCVIVLGNHDLHLLAAYYHHRTPGRKDTIDDILHSPESDAMLDWLRRQPLIHTDAELGVNMVHAGIHPEWSLARCRELAKEVETVLGGDRHVEFYRHMYGDKPYYWSPELTGWQRLRFITNVFTRVRYFGPDHRVNLSAKGAPGTQPKKQKPWFDIVDRATANDRIIFGHWSTLTLVERQYHNVYPIDNGCIWGGRLTALRIDVEQYQHYDVNCSQRQRPGPGVA